MKVIDEEIKRKINIAIDLVKIGKFTGIQVNAMEMLANFLAEKGRMKCADAIRSAIAFSHAGEQKKSEESFGIALKEV